MRLLTEISARFQPDPNFTFTIPRAPLRDVGLPRIENYSAALFVSLDEHHFGSSPRWRASTLRSDKSKSIENPSKISFLINRFISERPASSEFQSLFCRCRPNSHLS